MNRDKRHSKKQGSSCCGTALSLHNGTDLCLDARELEILKMSNLCCFWFPHAFLFAALGGFWMLLVLGRGNRVVFFYYLLFFWHLQKIKGRLKYVMYLKNFKEKL